MSRSSYEGEDLLDLRGERRHSAAVAAEYVVGR
jgi:hypothetical protein